jgi:hypothetical protein
VEAEEAEAEDEDGARFGSGPTRPRREDMSASTIVCIYSSRSATVKVLFKVCYGPIKTTVTSKGPSTRVRICVRIAIRFRARFVRKQNRDPILFLSPITIVCLHISAEKIKNVLAGHFWQQIVHRIVWGFMWEFARVDSP